MKLKIILLFNIGILIIFFSLLGPGLTTAQTGARFKPFDIQPTYSQGEKGKLVLQSVTVNESYSVLIGANYDTLNQKWVNFTSEKPNVLIKFIHDKTAVDSNGTALNDIVFNLYFNDVLIDTTTYELITFDDQWNLDFIIEALPDIIYFLIVGSVVIIFFAGLMRLRN